MIDKDTDKEVKLYSSNVQILTRHPANSYKLVLDTRNTINLWLLAPIVSGVNRASSWFLLVYNKYINSKNIQ